MKQTAVEWLKKRIRVELTYEQDVLFEELFDQAKEMEKEQHKVTAQDFYYGSHSFKDFEQYYNETYKQQEQ